MVLGAFPAFFTALLALYVFGLQLNWFPIQHAYASDVIPGFNWEFIARRVPPRATPDHHHRLAFTGAWVLNMRTVMINTISEDYVTMAHAKGLRDRRVMTRYAGRNAILPPLNGFAPLFASAVGGLVFIEFIFSYPGAGFTLQQAVLGNDYALAQGLLVVLSVCVILANLFMDIFNFVLDPRLRRLDMSHSTRPSTPLAAPPARVRGRYRVPGWLLLLLQNRKSRIGLSMVGFVILIAIIAPWISVEHPMDFNLFDARQAPSWNHLFGTTDQGSDIFSQVVMGARRSLLLGLLAGAARPPSPRSSASPPPTSAGSSTRASTY